MAIFTMTLGNVVAIVQNNVKRMLAYSSIAHAGYALSVASRPAASDPTQRNEAITAVMFYLLTYAVMNIGAFAVVQMIARSNDRRTSIEDYSGSASIAGARQASLFMPQSVWMPLMGRLGGKISCSVRPSISGCIRSSSSACSTPPSPLITICG